MTEKISPATHIWVGGYTADMGGTASGIALLQRSPDGTLTLVGAAAVTPSPSYLLRVGDTVYATGESTQRISAFQIADDTLQFLGRADAAGPYPCALSAAGPFLLDACYGYGSVGVRRLTSDGRPQPVHTILRGAGSGPHPNQEQPHAHDALLVDDSTVLTTDLGTDSVHVHRLDESGLVRTGSVSLPAGSGPRDLFLHSPGVVWVLGELSNILFVLTELDGSFVVSGSCSLMGAEPGDQAAAIAVDSTRRFAYVGLRGSNRISVVGVSADGRTLTPHGSTACGGAGPRHLVVAGEQLYVANQLSNAVTSFQLGNPGSPELSETLDVASPTYLLVT
ncbi:MAG TPA: beta-propeller fold lactonase family protein [Glaciihabitans sp.]|nr:beta-propeller fold lactonase family protein [Glaciihabitans sp.]